MKKINCFVIMPFSETIIEGKSSSIQITSDEWSHIFEHWIKKAVESYGENLVCKRSPLRPGNFVKGIIGDISESDITIADLTGGKPNVYYELGVRHALRNGTIIISQCFEHVPSDLRSYHCFEYNYVNEAHKYEQAFLDFEKRLHRYIDHILNNNYPSDNPVSDYLEVDKFMKREMDRVEEGNVFGSDRFLVKVRDGKEVILKDDIIYMEVMGGGYTSLITNKRRYTFRKSMMALMNELDYKPLKRTHRCYIININKVKVITKDLIFLDHHFKVNISERYRKELGF